MIRPAVGLAVCLRYAAKTLSPKKFTIKGRESERERQRVSELVCVCDKKSAPYAAADQN